MKKHKIAITVLSAAILATTALGATLLPHALSADAIGEITEQDILKVACALNLSTDSDVYDLGLGYQIFDVHNAEFSGLFTNNSDATREHNYSITGWNRAEFSSKYATDRAIGVDAEIKVPIYGVSAKIDANFQTSISSSLTSINEEYFEYWEHYQQTRVITTDWRARDLTNYFSDIFVDALTAVNSVEEATDFLKKYGTHVFDRYYLGGSLIITNYVASENSITEEYKNKNESYEIGYKIEGAVDLNLNGSESSWTATGVNTATTKSKMDMHSHGGRSLRAISVDHLFTYNHDFATSGGSGYVYKDWMDSLADHVNERVIKADNPVAIWELLRKSDYYSAEREALLIQAFDIMSFTNYVDLCKQSEVNSEIVDEVSYSSAGVNVKVDLSSDQIKLPSGISADFTFGKFISDNFTQGAAEFALKQNYSFAHLSNNRLTLDDDADGEELVLCVKLYDKEIFLLNITIQDSGVYANGYGTKDQPYLISSASEWNAFFSGRNFDQKIYYRLVSDINLGGQLPYESGGGRNAFKGELDGDGHVISNFSIIAKAGWKNIGLIGENYGVIKNLIIDNARCMNSGIFQATEGEINAGILVGNNHGTLENIQIKNSSIRVSAQPNSGTLNIGAVSGNSTSDISFSGVTNCNVYGITWKGNGTVNVGGIAGRLSESSIANCYVRNSSLNASNEQGGSKAAYTLGGLVGLVYSDREYVAHVDSCIAYNNRFNTTSNAFGYIAGNASAKNSFRNCYFEATSDSAVNGTTMDNCKSLRDMSLAAIGNSEINQNWTTDQNGKVILKKHA